MAKKQSNHREMTLAAANFHIHLAVLHWLWSELILGTLFTQICKQHDAKAKTARWLGKLAQTGCVTTDYSDHVGVTKIAECIMAICDGTQYPVDRGGSLVRHL